MADDRKHKGGKPIAELTDRRRRALELRSSGLGYDEIAVQVGYSNRGAAHKAVQEALKDTLREPAEQVRQMESERLDRLTLGLWDKAITGDMDAIDRMLRIMKRRAELLGLDAPTKLAVDQSTKLYAVESSPETL